MVVVQLIRASALGLCRADVTEVQSECRRSICKFHPYHLPCTVCVRSLILSTRPPHRPYRPMDTGRIKTMAMI